MFSNKKADSGVAVDIETPSFGASSSNRSQISAGYKAGGVAVHSMVDEFLTMRGDLESEGDIHVKGKVFGNIRCKLLIIEVDALVEGGVKADEVVVRGNAKGTIEADRVRLERTANVDSEICHLSFSAEEGARIRGSLRCRDEAADKEPSAKEAPRPFLTRAKEDVPAKTDAA